MSAVCTVSQGISTFTCSLACAMELLHDETNTKLSIEQPIDLKPRADFVKPSTVEVLLKNSGIVT